MRATEIEIGKTYRMRGGMTGYVVRRFWWYTSGGPSSGWDVIPKERPWNGGLVHILDAGDFLEEKVG